MPTQNVSQPTSGQRAAERSSHADPSVLDEVFAELPDFELRLDAPQRPAAKANYASETEQLVATIGAQLQAIDAQRTRLVRLLTEMRSQGNF